jgi:hypothetical protein
MEGYPGMNSWKNWAYHESQWTGEGFEKKRLFKRTLEGGAQTRFVSYMTL